MNFIKFVSNDYIKKFTQLNTAVDEALIEPAMKTAQEINLRRQLNPCLYDKLVTLIDNAQVGDVGNELYKTLLDDYIPDVVTHWTLVYLYPYLQIKIDNSSFNKHSKENAEAPSQGEVKNLIESERTISVHYENIMLDWLNDSDNRIDEFFNCTECQTQRTVGTTLTY